MSSRKALKLWWLKLLLRLLLRLCILIGEEGVVRSSSILDAIRGRLRDLYTGERILQRLRCLNLRRGLVHCLRCCGRGLRGCRGMCSWQRRRYCSRRWIVERVEWVVGTHCSFRCPPLLDGQTIGIPACSRHRRKRSGRGLATISHPNQRFDGVVEVAMHALQYQGVTSRVVEAHVSERCKLSVELIVVVPNLRSKHP